MNTGPLMWDDLHRLGALQPEGWSDIVPDYQFYIRSPYCNPIKVEDKGDIIGIGASISFGRTAWLAHVIVDKRRRGIGVGSFIVNELITILESDGVETCSLIATELGQPVYEKAGFCRQTDYIFMRRELPWRNRSVDPSVGPSDSNHVKEILELDRNVSGEDRRKLIEEHLDGAMVYVRHGRLRGFYLPRLKEGLIIAENEEAGLALMEVKYATADKAVVPVDNKAGLDFLSANGFAVTQSKGTRMSRGSSLNVSLSKIYSRIGGNLG